MNNPEISQDLLMYGVSFEVDGKRIHPERVSVVKPREEPLPWWEFWYQKGEIETANDFAAFEKAEMWRLSRGCNT